MPDHEFLELGIIGYPLGHTLSPAIHEAALSACGLQGAYRSYPILPLPGGQVELEKIISLLRQEKIHGLNVTIPHKQAVLALVDRLSPAAQAIGAVNTLLLRHGELYGENTDAPGFLADLKNVFSPGMSLPKSALILGAGGSARAIAYALLTSGCQVSVAARRLEQAQALAASFSAFASAGITALSLTPANLAAWAVEAVGSDQHPLVVNCTALGMNPNAAESPWPQAVSLPPGTCVYDLVYNPPETLLLRGARQAGYRAVNGVGMLVEQAALAFEIWTGLAAPRREMAQIVERINDNQR